MRTPAARNLYIAINGGGLPDSRGDHRSVVKRPRATAEFGCSRIEDQPAANSSAAAGM
jgi:hypothetical protein